MGKWQMPVFPTNKQFKAVIADIVRHPRGTRVECLVAADVDITILRGWQINGKLRRR